VTTGPLVEYVPNVSEGRDAARLARFASAISATPGVRLANVHADPDHHRSVASVGLADFSPDLYLDSWLCPLDPARLRAPRCH
jgi:hypothetical protein